MVTDAMGMLGASLGGDVSLGFRTFSGQGWAMGCTPGDYGLGSWVLHLGTQTLISPSACGAKAPIVAGAMGDGIRCQEAVPMPLGLQLGVCRGGVQDVSLGARA